MHLLFIVPLLRLIRPFLLLLRLLLLPPLLQGRGQRTFRS